MVFENTISCPIWVILVNHLKLALRFKQSKNWKKTWSGTNLNSKIREFVQFGHSDLKLNWTIEVSHNKLFSTWLTCSLFPFFLKSVMHDLVDIWKTTWQHLNNVASTLSSDFKSTTTMKRFLLRRFSVPKRLLLSFKSTQQKLHHFNKCVRKNYSINYVGDVDAESGFDINTPQKNDSNILTAKKGYHQLCQKPNQTPCTSIFLVLR